MIKETIKQTIKKIHDKHLYYCEYKERHLFDVYPTVMMEELANEMIKEMKKTIVDMTNKGKSSTEIFEALVDDKYIYDEESGEKNFRTL